jgi:predicted secreted hydrolase
VIDRSRSLLMALVGLILLGGCFVADDPSADRDISDTQERPADRILEQRDDPQPIVFPDDLAPHDRLTEWWYYTGHVQDDNANLYGFQFVIFQVRRGDFPPTWAAHFAVTDTSADRFSYAERLEVFEVESADQLLDLEVADWRLQSDGETHRIIAEMDGYRLDVSLSAEKDPVLHEDDGYFEFAPGAESYYYSETRMNAEGSLTVDGNERSISGEAWFDQQWGDFLVFDTIGWDWFSVQLDHGYEVMAWQSHDRQGNILDSNATILDPDGVPTDVAGEQLTITALDTWTSSRSGGTYPMGWTLEIESQDLELRVHPVMQDQELITLESTGVIYWEGMVAISGTMGGTQVEGLGYVELTGYADLEMLLP